jgi:hypothetical protein
VDRISARQKPALVARLGLSGGVPALEKREQPARPARCRWLRSVTALAFDRGQLCLSRHSVIGLTQIRRTALFENTKFLKVLIVISSKLSTRHTGQNGVRVLAQIAASQLKLAPQRSQQRGPTALSRQMRRRQCSQDGSSEKPNRLPSQGLNARAPLKVPNQLEMERCHRGNLADREAIPLVAIQ